MTNKLGSPFHQFLEKLVVRFEFCFSLYSSFQRLGLIPESGDDYNVFQRVVSTKPFENSNLLLRGTSDLWFADTVQIQDAGKLAFFVISAESDIELSPQQI